MVDHNQNVKRVAGVPLNPPGSKPHVCPLHQPGTATCFINPVCGRGDRRVEHPKCRCDACHLARRLQVWAQTRYNDLAAVYGDGVVAPYFDWPALTDWHPHTTNPGDLLGLVRIFNEVIGWSAVLTVDEGGNVRPGSRLDHNQKLYEAHEILNLRVPGHVPHPVEWRIQTLAQGKAHPGMSMPYMTRISNGIALDPTDPNRKAALRRANRAPDPEPKPQYPTPTKVIGDPIEPEPEPDVTDEVPESNGDVKRWVKEVQPVDPDALELALALADDAEPLIEEAFRRGVLGDEWDARAKAWAELHETLHDLLEGAS